MSAANPRDTRILGQIELLVRDREHYASKVRELRSELEVTLEAAVIISKENSKLRHALVVLAECATDEMQEVAREALGDTGDRCSILCKLDDGHAGPCKVRS